jgi:hypothetical protein
LRFQIGNRFFGKFRRGALRPINSGGRPITIPTNLSVAIEDGGGGLGGGKGVRRGGDGLDAVGSYEGVPVGAVFAKGFCLVDGAGLAGGLDILFEGGESLLGTGEVGGAEGVAEGLQFRGGRSAGCEEAVRACGLDGFFNFLLESSEGTLGAGEVARLECALEGEEILVAVYDAGLVGRDGGYVHNFSRRVKLMQFIGWSLDCIGGLRAILEGFGVGIHPTKD